MIFGLSSQMCVIDCIPSIAVCYLKFASKSVTGPTFSPYRMVPIRVPRCHTRIPSTSAGKVDLLNDRGTFAVVTFFFWLFVVCLSVFGSCSNLV